MAKNSAVNLDITNNADGFDVSGGSTARKLTLTAADVVVTGGAYTLTLGGNLTTGGAMVTADAFTVSGGAFTLTNSGGSTIDIAGNLTLTGGACTIAATGSNVFTFPASTSTLVSLQLVETITGVKTVGTNVKLHFRDAAISINSAADGHLDLDADIGIDLNGTTNTQNVQPLTDDTYYLGKNDDDTPFAYKGLILKDTTDGKYYRIEVINGTVTATDLTD